MIANLRSRIRERKLDRALKIELQKEIVFVNFSRGLIFTAVLAILFALLLAVDYLNKSKGLWERPGYYELFLVHCATGAALIILLPFFLFMRPAGRDHTDWHHGLIVMLMGLAMMVSAVSTSLVDQLIHGQISVYVIMTFALGAALIMGNLTSIVIYIAAVTAFLIGLGYVQHDPQQLQGHYLNVTTLTLVAWILSRVVYGGFKNNFLRNKTIESQKDTILERDGVNSQLMESLASVSDNLTDSFGQLSKHSESLSYNLQMQSASLQEMTATTEEVSAGSESVRASVEEQNRAMERLAGKLAELTAITVEMSERIDSAIRRIGEIAGAAATGEQIINRMSDSMSEIGGTSREMAGIVTIINDISDRINLLSLNAAIEAARAGDTGRGFAVVADEIGKLADQTSSSVKEIDQLIRKSDAEVQRGKESVTNAVGAVSGIISGVSDINDVIMDVSGAMEKNSSTANEVSRHADRMRELSDEISKASEEQKNATVEIVKAITDINQFSLANAESSEEFLQLSRKVETLAREIREKAASNKSAAGH